MKNTVLVLVVVAILAAFASAQTEVPCPPEAPQPQSTTPPAPYVPNPTFDSESFSLVLAAQAGSGWNPGVSRQWNTQAGVKLGIPIEIAGKAPKDIIRTATLDLQYDRTSARSGFSTEGSLMLPLLRFPNPRSDESRKFIRVYAEPGIGYRAGGGPFGGYASAKVMVLFLSGKRLYVSDALPYLEFQRRFPFGSPLRGDNRLSFGIMVAICKSCGFD